MALGRAIVRSPQAFLMDEPLSNLDAKLRVQMRSEIISLHKKIGVTTIYVTHDQIEAMTMGDRIVVMNKGVIQQVDTPERIYNKPKNIFVAKFIGNQPMNFFEGRLEEKEGYLEFHTDTFKVRLTDKQAQMLRANKQVEYSVVMGIRPEHTGFEKEVFESFPHATLSGVLDFNEFIGSDHYYHLNARGKESFTVRAHPRYRYEEGEQVTVALDMDKALFFDQNTGKLLTD